MPSLERDILLMGSAKVGKTSMLNQIRSQTFDENYTPSGDDIYVLKYDYNGEQISLAVTDIGGEAGYTKARLAEMNRNEGFIAVYDICSANSFRILQEMMKWLRDIRLGKALPIVLVGCKADMDFFREVMPEEAAAYAQSEQIPFMEISAKKTEDVVAVFNKIISEMNIPYSKRPQIPIPPAQERKIRICCVIV